MTTNQQYVRRANELEQLQSTRPLVRALNFHNTSAERSHIFGRQLEICSQYFSPVSEDDLDEYLQTGEWHKNKPRTILGFVEEAPADQLDCAIEHGIGIESCEYDDGRYAMNWSELRELDRAHVIASHALSHESIAPVNEAQRIAEVFGSQQTFADRLGHPVRTFVSRCAPAYGDQASTDRLIDAAGYQFVFSNFRIQRLRANSAKKVPCEGPWCAVNCRAHSAAL
jgi:hypothetical protein